MMQRLVLWDIDGTLVRGGKAVAEAYEYALRAIYRLEGEIARVATARMTDGQIALDTLAQHGLAEAAVLSLLDDFRDAYSGELERIKHRIAEDLEVLPGVRAVLARLGEVGVWQSLLTGNFEATARLKLTAVDLDRTFDFAVGAFGSDHRDRNCLVPIAIAKAQQVRGIALTPEQVVVVGDTPRDIACARAGGARVVAVATGRFSTAELALHAPDVLLDTLGDTERALAAILAD